MRRLLLSIVSLVLLATSAMAQSDDMGYGLSVGTEKKIVKGLKFSAEAEARSQNGLSDLERWSIDLSLSYKLTPWLKSDVGYAFINRYHTSEVTSKGNTINGFWGPRHRYYAGLTGSMDLGRWKLSLRERYQLTHSPLQYVPKYRADGKRLTDEVEGDDQDHTLRSRLAASYNIKHSKFEPFASIELLNNLTSGFAIDQVRYTVGTDYKLNKHSALTLQWRYKDRAGDDEGGGHLVTLGYNISF